jgi:hypothetical protein
VCVCVCVCVNAQRIVRYTYVLVWVHQPPHGRRLGTVPTHRPNRHQLPTYSYLARLGSVAAHVFRPAGVVCGRGEQRCFQVFDTVLSHRRTEHAERRLTHPTDTHTTHVSTGTVRTTGTVAITVRLRNISDTQAHRHTATRNGSGVASSERARASETHPALAAEEVFVVVRHISTPACVARAAQISHTGEAGCTLCTGAASPQR